jgi:hypothetical protein
MYEAYKPFRNYLRQFPLVPSLQWIWCLSQHLEHDALLPAELWPPATPFGQPKGLKGTIFPWDLDILSREIVLNSPLDGVRSLGRHRDLTVALKHIRRLDNVASGAFFDAGGDVTRELHRISHRQFPWQRPPDRLSLTRYMRVFSHPDVAPFVEVNTGLTVKQLYQIAFGICGQLLRQPGLLSDQDYGELGISGSSSEIFFNRYAISVAKLREMTRAQQRYDGRWLYAWNPLHATPLVKIDPSRPQRMVCPIPMLLMRRVSEGLFYDLVAAPGFGEAFGRSFQSYIGEVLNRAFGAPPFTVRGEAEYRVGKNRKDGVDWIVEDADAVMFIECKTSRLRLDAKISSDTAALEAALDGLAAAVVQNYKNICDAEAGKTDWRYRGKPGFPIIVTLEDWWIFGRVAFDLLRDGVRRQLKCAGLDPRLVEAKPYTVASAGDLELAVHAIAEVGVLGFLRKKTEGDELEWALSPFSTHHYPDALARARETQPHQEWWSELAAPAAAARVDPR